MPVAAPADPERFPEASKWFRERVAVTKAEWSQMTADARRQAFTIAGTQQLEVVQLVMAELQAAIDKGTPIDEWRKNVATKLGKRFGKLNPSHLTTAFINANQTAYNTGRWYQMQTPEVMRALPWRRWDSVMDQRTSTPCSECNGTLLPADHPWWLTHFPPLHHRCRSTVRALSERMARRAGGETEAPRPNISGDFGLAPPLRSFWEPDTNKYESHAAREYKRKQQRMTERARKRRTKA